MAVKAFALFVFLFACAVSAQPSIQSEPSKQSKWEAGFAVGGFYLPDYPGAEESRARVIPLPYVFYRGDVFRADRDGGVRGRFINKERIEFDVSVEAAFPVDSENNKAREGMESLDWLGEVGPRLVYHITHNPKAALDFKFPVRYVFSTDVKHWNSRGFTVNPILQLKHRTNFDPHLVAVAKLEGTWATEKLMSYIYDVEPQFALPDRPQYQAKPGFLGSSVSVSLLKVFPAADTVLFTGVTWNSFKGSANEASPLMKDRYTASVFAGIAVSIYKSEEKEN